MSQVQIGDYTTGGHAKLSVQQFIETRGLLQANSGGGKSYSLRRLIEMLCSGVQTIIIDTEGEFVSLREKFDFVVAAASGGDAIAHPKTAALMARRLLETRVSAILDISELKARQRDEFVCNFLIGLMELPRDLWGELLLVLDEAHVYCPEKGQGEALSTDAVIDLASRGRKRGFCLLAATQRVAKFNKSAAAELLNKFVGRTGLDVDVKRAAFDLGMTAKDAQAVLPHLEHQFFAYGPAISKTVQLMKFDPVTTTHPKSGSRAGRKALVLPKPTDAIRSVLPQLADLQAEQEQKAKTEDDLRKELAQAKRDILAAQRAQQPAAPSANDLKAAEIGGYNRACALSEGVRRTTVEQIGARFDHLAQAFRRDITDTLALIGDTLPAPVPKQHGKYADPMQRPAAAAPTRGSQPSALRSSGADNMNASSGQRRILIALAQRPGERVSQRRLSLLAGLSMRSGTWSTYLSRLRSDGHAEGREDLRVTDAGLEAAGEFAPLPTGEELIDYWRGKIGSGSGMRSIFDALVAAYPAAVAQAQLAETCNLSPKSGTWSTYLSRLRGLGLIDGRAELRASEDLFA